MAHPLQIQHVTGDLVTRLDEAATANQAAGAAQKRPYTPQKVDPPVFLKAL